MAIQFKAVEKGQPGVAGGGVKKFYASPVQDGEVTIETLTKGIERACTVNGADIRAVLYALVDQAVDALADGRIVRLGDLGSLRVTLSSQGEPTANQVTSSSIKDASIIFTPGFKIKAMLATAKFTKV